MFSLLLTTTIMVMMLNEIESFEEISISFTIDEEQPNGTQLIDLRQYFIDQRNEYIDTYQREFLHPCQYFYFGSHQTKNPWYIFLHRLDREQLCPYDEQCHLICQFYLKNDQMKLVQIHLFLRDLNDHRGRFLKRNYFFELNENLPIGFRLQLEQVYDEDFDSTKKSYHLNYSSFYSNPSNRFPFDLSFDSTKHLLELILIDHLNVQQQQPFYHFQLIANENQQIEDQCHIEIAIRSTHVDSQQIPSFQQPQYHFFVEHIESNAFIGQVHLNITERADNLTSKSNIFFRILSSKSQLNDQQFDLFRLNETTGEIFFKSFSLFQFDQNDFRQHEHFQLIIEAFNTDFFSSLTTVFLHLNSSSSSSLRLNNDDEDRFLLFIPKALQQSSQTSSSSDQQDFIIKISENSPVPLTLCQLFLSSSSSSSVSSMSNEKQIKMKTTFNSNSFLLQRFDDQLFDFILVKSLDYEVVKNISIEFLLSTSSSSTNDNDQDEQQNQQQRKSLEIIVENQNDCSPFFTQAGFHFQIEENLIPPTTPFFTFQAYDADEDLHPSLQYSLNFSSLSDQQQQQFFQLDSYTGDLMLLEPFDRELQPNYSLHICVDDQLHRSCVPLHLQILDQNDHRCSFPTSRIQLNLHENLPANTFLTQIIAQDLDLDENATLFYSLSPPSPYLHLHSSTAILTTTSIPFDYETIQNYSTTIMACDNVHHPHLSLCCSIDLILHIQDQNDHQPYLIYPSLDHNDIFVIRYINQTMMPVVKAFDEDLDQRNNRINFTIQGGSLNSSVTIHPHTGQLLLKNPSSTHFPLYGTLLLSLSSQTSVVLTLLIHDNHTDPQLFLRSIRSATSFTFYYYYYFILFIVILLLLPFVFLIPQVLKRKDQGVSSVRHQHSLLPTTSTTTLSSKSLSNHKRSFETYYSFGDTLSPNCTQI